MIGGLEDGVSSPWRGNVARPRTDRDCFPKGLSLHRFEMLFAQGQGGEALPLPA